MNSITKFFHELINPHCQHCIDERRENKICSSCEILQLQVARLQYENEKLLSKILEKPVEEIKINTEDLKPIQNKAMPWRVRQQALEREDRRTAQLLKQNESITTEDLEKEMDIAAKERESGG